ncbi:MAG: GNAT family N-acetyltransferase [Actinomycetota bacterium]
MADVSVRPARPGDVAEIARIQIDTWRTAYTCVLPTPVLDGLSGQAAEQAWQAAVAAPPTASHHVLVALEQHCLVGFTALGPADDLEPAAPDRDRTVLIGSLLVEPRWGRRGHGSRLLAAAVDHALEDGMTRAITWVPSSDLALLSFYRGAGWDTDGYARTLDTGAGELREIRLHAALGATG